MRKLIYLVLILSLFLCCGPKGEEIEKYIEDGVEVIVNHIEPYKIKGEPSTLILEELFTIDTAQTEIARRGLFYITEFAVDSEGNIYCTCSKNPEYFIFKFNRNGSFDLSFGKKGRGPGEIGKFARLAIDHNDEIEIFDSMSRRLSFFNKDGTLIRESTLNSRFSQIRTLENENYLVLGPSQIVEPSSGNGIHTPLRIMNSEFKEIKELDNRITPNIDTATKMKYSEHIFQWSISNGKIFVVNEERGYEILVYDLEGHLIRKIKKEYNTMRFPDEIKLKFRETMKRFADRVYFPATLAPFQSIFTDDKGRLYVTTYERRSGGIYENQNKGYLKRFISFSIYPTCFLQKTRSRMERDNNSGKRWSYDC